MDIFTGAGEVVTDHARASDLFDTFPNSYGSLGYATRLRIKLEQVPSYVDLRHVRFDDAGLLAKTIAEIVETREYDGVRVDGLDGTAFAAGGVLPDPGRRGPTGPPTGAASDYTGQQIYYRSIQQRETDLLTMYDYLWRWDTDWFWCSRRLRRPAPARPPALAAALQALATSTTGWSASTTASASAPGSTAAQGNPERERVVQDVEIPVERLGEFLDWFDAEVGMRPVWLCPLRRGARSGRPTRSQPGEIYVNVGFWGNVAVGPDAPNAPAQPRDRGQGARARRPQVALLRGVLRPRDVRPALRRRQPGAGQGAGTTPTTG